MALFRCGWMSGSGGFWMKMNAIEHKLCWAEAAGETLVTDQGSAIPGFPYVCNNSNGNQSKKYDVVSLDRHAQQGSIWHSRRKYSPFIIRPKGMKINHLPRWQKSARATVLTSEPSQVSSFPYSWQAGLFLASDVTGLSWSSLVTVGRVGAKSWVRLIAGGGVCVTVEVSPAAPLRRVTPIRRQMLSYITVLDTASLCLTPALHPPLSHLSLLSLAPSALVNWLDISFNIDCIIATFHLSGRAIAGAPEANRAKNILRGNTPVLSWCSAFEEGEVEIHLHNCDAYITAPENLFYGEFSRNHFS